MEHFKAETDRHYENIDKHINAANYLLGAFSFIITVVGIYLSIHISNIHGKVVELTREANNSANRANDIKKWIETDINRIYRMIRREETDAIIKTLQNRPESILTYANVLKDMDLDPRDFKVFKNITLATQQSSDGEVSLFGYQAALLILFLKFPQQTVLDDDLRDEFIGHFHQYFRYVTPLIQNSFNKIISAAVERGIDNSVQIFVGLFMAFGGLTEPKQRFLLRTMIDALNDQSSIIFIARTIPVISSGEYLSSLILFHDEIEEKYGQIVIASPSFNLVRSRESLRELLASMR